MSDEDTTQDTEAPEAEDETPTDSREESEESELEEVDLDEAAKWDPDRALKKIRKLNNEVRSAKKRAEETESTASKSVTEAHALVAREKVARRLGLADNDDTDEFLGRLKGEDVDALMQDAERLLSLIAGSAKRPATRKPTEALRGGLEPDKEPEETDLSKLGERMFRR